MKRKQFISLKTAFNFSFSKHGFKNVDTSYPVLYKAIQSELELILVNVLERLISLRAEYSGLAIPDAIINAFKQREFSNDVDCSNLMTVHPLVVKANPDKPLTLIISQRSNFCPTSSPLISETSNVNRSKLCNGITNQRCNRSSVEDSREHKSSPSPTKVQCNSSYDVPNKFWELMEPYCAEITESNIGYLEGLIRSYQDLESVYFQLPSPVKVEEKPKIETESPTHKRLKKDSTPANLNDESRFDFLDASGASSTTFNLTTVSNFLEAELKKPISDSSYLNKFAHSVLESCSHGDVHAHLLGSNAVASPKHPEIVTLEACKPLKILANELQVDSSYRVEKKINQAIDELGGLFSPNSLDPNSTPPQSHHHCSTFGDSQFKLDSPPPPHRSDHHVSVIKAPSTKLIIRNLKATKLPSSNNFALSNSDSTADLIDIESGAAAQPQFNRVASFNDNHKNKLRTKIVWRAKKANNIFKKKSRMGNYKKKLRNNDLQLKNREEHCNGYLPDADDQTDTNDTEPLNQDGFGESSQIVENGILTTDDDDDDVNEEPMQLEDEVKMDSTNDTGNQTLKSRFCHIFSPGKKSGRTKSGSVSRNMSLSPDGHCSNLHSSVNNNNNDLDEKHTKSVLNDENGIDENSENSWNTLHANHNQKIHADTTMTNNNNNTTTLTINPSSCSQCKTLGDSEQNQLFDHLNCGNVPSEITKKTFQTKFELVCAENLIKMGLDLSTSKDDTLHDVTLQQTGSTSSTSGRNTRTNRSNCCMDSIGNAVLQNQLPGATNSSCAPNLPACGFVNDEIGWEIFKRQQELRNCSTANLNTLRRLVQAARRDMQRQEIQRRLAIADADVIEAYDKLESYRPQRKPPLKRDRDMAWKALKERRKILKELELFDCKSPP